jgi:hypothetical protein
MINLVTSFNRKLLNEYANNFLAGWKKQAKDGINLIVCYEGDVSDLLEFEGNNIQAIGIESENQIAFKRRYSNLLQANGHVPYKSVSSDGNETVNIVYNYRYDAIRFSFKIFSLIKSLELIGIDEDLCWIDSDIVCLRNFSEQDLRCVMPGQNQIASYLGRERFPQPNPYSECGFVGFNGKNQLSHQFLHHMLSFYMSGEIFALPEWHDCMVFDTVRRAYEAEGYSFLNLSGHLTESDHPFMETPLGDFFDHLKGPQRKLQGHS